MKTNNNFSKLKITYLQLCLAMTVVFSGHCSLLIHFQTETLIQRLNSHNTQVTNVSPCVKKHNSFYPCSGEAGEKKGEMSVSVAINIANYMQRIKDKRWLHTELHRMLVFLMIKTLHLYASRCQKPY